MKAVFLDRDGVLNRDSPGFVTAPEGLIILPGIPEAIARLNAAGFAAVVITNQSGIARGYMTEHALEAIHARLRAAVEAAGGHLTAIYHCPHMPDAGCPCRKPAPGMVLLAAREHGLDPAQSWFVGDKPIDIACGAAAGCRTVLVLSGLVADYVPARFSVPPDHVCRNLSEAAELILSEERRHDTEKPASETAR